MDELLDAGNSEPNSKVMEVGSDEDNHNVVRWKL